MPVILLCSPSDLDGELSNTVLWREGMQHYKASRFDEALSACQMHRPSMVVVDRRFPRSTDLISAIRKDTNVRTCSIVVLARGDFESSEIDLLEAGANAILRFPAGRDWDERLDRLLNVPARREGRFGVEFAVDARHAGGEASGSAMNLSVHGMLLQTKAELSVGDEVTFSFRLPDAFVNGDGTVVRQAGPNLFGIFFAKLEGDSFEQIRRYVSTLA